MSVQVETTQFADLTCRVVDALDGAAPQLVVVLSHGFGAPGTDLVSMAGDFLQLNEKIASSVRFVFPEAPIDLGPMGLPGGRAWWPFNMAQLAAMHQTRDFSQLTDVEPEGLQKASGQLFACVRAILDQYGMSEDRMFLGGFSQGAMVCTDLVLRQQFCPSHLVLMSGMLLCRREWSKLAGQHPGCSVIQTHGTQDMILPLGPASELRELLAEQGFDVAWQDFMGPHTVPEECIVMTAHALLQKLATIDVA